MQYLLFPVLGLAYGSVYAALALGLVTTYKGTGVINFAQGAMAVWGAYAYDALRRSGDLVLPVVWVPSHVHLGRLPFWACLVIGLASGALIGLMVHVLVFTPLRRAPSLAKVVASLGVMLTLQSLVTVRFGPAGRGLAPILPDDPIHVGTLNFARDRIYLAGVIILIAATLWAYFRFTRPGLAARAAAENEVGVALTGTSPERLAAGTWVLSSVVTTLMVILASPTNSLDAGAYTLFVVRGLAVALIGRFSSFGVVCAAGLALGAFEAEVQLLTTKSWWPDWLVTGFTSIVPLIVTIVALFLLGDRLPTRAERHVRALPAVVRPRNRIGVVIPLIVGGALLLALTHSTYRFGVISSMVFTITSLSLVVLTGFVGQISLAQAALAGSSAFVLAKIGQAAGFPFPLSLFVAVLVAMIAGVAVGIPALRIRGAQLAVVTLAGAIATEHLVFRNPELIGRGMESVPQPRLFGLDLAIRRGVDISRLSYGYLVLAVLVLITIAIANLLRSDTGRAFLAVRSNERAAAAGGVNVSATKLLAFAISSFVAGMGGAFIGYTRGQLLADSFGVFAGVNFLAFAYLGGITNVSGAFVAGLFAPLGLVYVWSVRNPTAGRGYLLTSGVSLVIASILSPEGIAGRVRQVRAWVLRPLARRPAR